MLSNSHVPSSPPKFSPSVLFLSAYFPIVYKIKEPSTDIWYYHWIVCSAVKRREKEIFYFRETRLIFRDLKNSAKLKSRQKKGATKIKDGLFSDLYENLYLSFSSARSARSSVLESFSSAHVLIPYHLTHLAKLGPAIAILPQHSLQTCHQHILYKAQICLQLGIRLKFRNKWSQETALMRLRSI